MDAKQQKTFVGIILIVLLGATACCGLTVAVGAFFGYQEAQKAVASGPLDAGSRRAIAPKATDPDDQAPEVDALRQRFADEVLAGLADAGREDYVFQPETYDLVSDAGAQISLENLFAEYDDQPESERPQFVERTLRGFFPAEVPTNWAEAQQHVMATVRDRVFVELLALRSDKPLNVLQRPLSDDLVELVVYDGPDSMQYLNEDHLADWGTNADEVFLQGRRQLAAAARASGTAPPPASSSRPGPTTTTSAAPCSSRPCAGSR